MIGNLNGMIAAEFRKLLKADPELAEEFESKAELKSWIRERLSDDMSGVESKAIKAWLKRHIDIKVIMKEL